jgi:exodeoxyribonuclease VII large subunit
MTKVAELPLFAATSRQVLTVSELNEVVKETLESRLDSVWIAGEISNCRSFPSGHRYFTLKDSKCQLSAVMFRQQGERLSFMPENGMQVLCFGRVTLYTARGDLQLYVKTMEPRGKGALYLAFEQLKRKLAAEGLFAPERKRATPFLPVSIGIVTSEKGAALRDMLRIIADRFPNRRIVVRAVKVQGAGAAEEIAAGIAELDGSGAIDVMIIGRGGGSLEDLWAFNEEIVARAIFASAVPVISAVGHEIDFTIADFVADHRAPTPTAAAEMVLPRRDDLVKRMANLEVALVQGIEKKLRTTKETWSGLLKRLTDPGRKLRENQQRLDNAAMDLFRRFHVQWRVLKERLATNTARLDALSPLAVMQRGYSITYKLPEESILKNADSLGVGDRVRINFARGRAICRVEEKE